MPKTEMVRAYTESLLKQILGIEKVNRDRDGDYPIRFESALYYVRVDGGAHDDPVVQVFAIALDHISSSPELFEQLNRINTQLRFARAFWVHDQVLFESEMLGEELSIAGLGTACNTVGSAADYFGSELMKDFGGNTAFADEAGPDYERLHERHAQAGYL